MPTKLSVGFSKKVGTADYGSLGASCHVEFEIGVGLSPPDAAMFRQAAESAFRACRHAVEEQLAKESTAKTSAPESSGQNGHANGRRYSTRSSGRQATPSQVRAIQAIADRNDVDLKSLLDERFHIEKPDDLSLADASRLIDDLKQQTHSNGATR